MKIFDAAAVEQFLPLERLIPALRTAFSDVPEVPARIHHAIERPGAERATLLIMPAWRSGLYIGIKIVGVFPGNPRLGLPQVNGQYLLLSAVTGETLAVIDAARLTQIRTACVSALAASHLAPAEAGTLLMVGTGALAPWLIEAHCTVRPIKRVMIRGRDFEKAESLAKQLAHKLPQLAIEATKALQPAAREADIISCATSSRVPLVQGEWLGATSYVDLVGSFSPSMREVDSGTIGNAGLIVVDTLEAAASAGELTGAIADGVWNPKDAVTLSDCITRGVQADGRVVFKSVGTALADLAAASLLFEAANKVGI